MPSALVVLAQCIHPFVTILSKIHSYYMIWEPLYSEHCSTHRFTHSTCIHNSIFTKPIVKLGGAKVIRVLSFNDFNAFTDCTTLNIFSLPKEYSTTLSLLKEKLAHVLQTTTFVAIRSLAHLVLLAWAIWYICFENAICNYCHYWLECTFDRHMPFWRQAPKSC